MVDTCCESSKTLAIWSVCLKVQVGTIGDVAPFFEKRKLELAPAATSADHSHTPHVPHTEHSDGSHISMHILPGSATRGWVVAPAVNETLLIPCKVGGARTGEVQVPHRFRPGWMPCPVRFPKTNTAIRVMQPLPCTVGHSCRNVGATTTCRGRRLLGARGVASRSCSSMCAGCGTCRLG